MLIGLAIALAVAFYISRSSFPTLKVKPASTESVFAAGQLPDLNRPLYGNLEPARAAARELAEQLKNRPLAPAPALAALDTKAAPPLEAQGAPSDTKTSDKPDVDGKAGAETPTSAASPLGQTAPPPKAATSAAPVPVAPAPPRDIEKPVQIVYYVQAGAYHLRADAEAGRTHLAMAGITSQVTEHQADNGTQIYRLRVGPLANEEAVHESVRQVTTAGMEASVIRQHK